MSSEVVRFTKSGLVTRYDNEVGCFVYSPYTGLIYAVTNNDVPGVSAWLDKTQKNAPADVYESTLGLGWAVPLNDKTFKSSQLLPSIEEWPMLPKPKNPILINWFITGECPLACHYCYAEDLMRGAEPEPTVKDIERIAKTILSYKPLVVVLTGGDPLFSPRLQQAFEALHNKVGIMIDTSGYTLSLKHLVLFKKYNVAVRISLDSEIPKLNNKHRIVDTKYRALQKPEASTLGASIECLCKCLDAKITVSVQTVATHSNVNSLEGLGDKLFRLGVRSWRVLKVAPGGKLLDSDKYSKQQVSDSQNKHILEETLDVANRNRWEKQMALQVTHSKTPNAVILVSPIGNFLTESDTGSGKIYLDDERPRNPKQKSLFDRVNISEHAKRYLNLV